MSRPDTFMPLYIGDYLADTMRLTRDQHGGYLLLIMDYWRTGRPLPDDDDALAATVKATPTEWKRIRQALSPFFQISNGLWHHKRVDEELSDAKSAYERRRNAGEKGNAKQRAKRSALGSQSERNHNHTATQEGSPSELPSCDSSARPASRCVKTAPPVALEVPLGWEQKSEKWAEFRSKLSDGEWRAWFTNARLNGSETNLLVDGEFARDQVRYRYGKQLNEHFGRPVSIIFDPQALAAKP